MNKSNFLSLFLIVSFFIALLLFYNKEVFEYRTHSLPDTLSGMSFDLSKHKKDSNLDTSIINVKLDDSGNRIFSLKEISSKDTSIKKLSLLEEGAEVDVSNSNKISIEDFDISGSGTSAAYIYTNIDKLHSKENLKSVALWNEGLPEQILLENKLVGAWGISITKDGNKIIVYPKDKNSIKESAFIISLKPFKRLENYTNEVQNSNFREFTVDKITTTSLEWGKSDDKTNLASISKKKIRLSDMDGDGSDDMLVFLNQPGLPLWRAKTLSFMEGPNKFKSNEYGKFVALRLGDGMGIPLTGDYDGDGFLDLATYSPNHMIEQVKSTSNWQIFLSNGASLPSQISAKTSPKTFSLSWGFGKHYPLTGDYDGDGATDIITFNPELGTWHFLYSKGNFNLTKAQLEFPSFGKTEKWGAYGDYPMLGDLDGNGHTDLIVCTGPNKDNEANKNITPLHWRAKLNIPKSKAAREIDFHFGTTSDIPFIGDFNGDGRDEPAVFQPAINAWKIRYSLKDIGPKEETINWAVDGGHPLVGDFDADGITDLAFYSTVNKHRWYILSSIFKSTTPKLFPAGRTPVSAYDWGAEYVGALPPQVLQRKAYGFSK